MVILVTLTAATTIVLYTFLTYRPEPELDIVPLHLAILEVTLSPVNEVIVTVIVPTGVEVVFKDNSIIVEGALIDQRILIFNYTGIVEKITRHVIVYDPSRVKFEREVVLTETTTIKLVNVFGIIRIIPVGG